MLPPSCSFQFLQRFENMFRTTGSLAITGTQLFQSAIQLEGTVSQEMNIVTVRHEMRITV
jgi:hypothetical protein